MAGQLKVDSINADSNLTLRIANTAVAFIDSNGLRPSSGNVSLDATGTTGIGLPSANTLVFYEGGVEAMRIDSSGNVGIGTTPSSWDAKLAVFNGNIALTSTTNKLYLYYASATNFAHISTAADGSITFTNGTSSPTERMRIESGGNVKIGNGAASASARLMVNVTSGSAAAIQLFQDGNESWIISNPASSTALTFSNSGTERMRIDSSGNVGFGTTTPNSGIQAGTNVCIRYPTGDVDISHANGTVSGTGYIYFGYNAGIIGSITQNGTTATAYNTSSDYRLKENIAPMTGALAKVSQLKPCTYKWKSTGEESQGFIAHELAEVVPDCVTGEKDALDAEGKPVYQGVDTSFLVATLTAAIQELKEIVDAQATEIAALKAK